MRQDLGHLRVLLNRLVGRVVVEARLSPMGGHWLGIDLTGGCRIRTEMAPWRIESDQEFLIACEDHRNAIRGFVTELDGRSVTHVDVSSLLDLTVDFDGLRLVVTPVCTSGTNDTHWAVQLPSGAVVFAGPGSDWMVNRPA